MSAPVLHGLAYIDIRDVEGLYGPKSNVRHLRVKPTIFHVLTSILNFRRFESNASNIGYFPQTLIDYITDDIGAEFPKINTKESESMFHVTWDFAASKLNIKVVITPKQKPGTQRAPDTKDTKRPKLVLDETNSVDLTPITIGKICTLVYDFYLKMVGNGDNCPFLHHFREKHAEIVKGFNRDEVTIDLQSMLPFFYYFVYSLKGVFNPFAKGTWIANDVSSFILCQNYTYAMWAINYCIWKEDHKAQRATAAGIMTSLATYVMDKCHSLALDNSNLTTLFSKYKCAFYASMIIISPRLDDEVIATIKSNRLSTAGELVSLVSDISVNFTHVPSGLQPFSINALGPASAAKKVQQKLGLATSSSKMYNDINKNPEPSTDLTSNAKPSVTETLEEKIV